MRSAAVVAVSLMVILFPGPTLFLGGAGLQGEGVQLIAHAGSERAVDHLVLLHPALALEGGGHDMGRPMIVVVDQRRDGDARIGQSRLDELFDGGRVERHEVSGRAPNRPRRPPPYRRAATPR